MSEKVHRNYSKNKPDRLFVGNKKGVQHMSRWFGPAPVNESSRVRVWPFTVMAILIGVFLFGRLAQLTIVEGAYRRELADENRVVGIRRAAARGLVTDRNGVALVRNLPIYKKQVSGSTVAQAQFEEITHEEAVQQAYGSGEKVFFEVEREYLCGEACAVIMGYTGEIDEKELDQKQGDYVLGDRLGKTGLEKVYEFEMRGSPGSELVEVNAKGELVREVGRIFASSGVDIQLTIDSELQKVLYKALDGRKGAAVATVPQTGEVLAMVSSPSYDPNNVSNYLEAEDMPFFNRVIGGAYPPGSVFKIVTAAAGLEEEVIDEGTQIQDTGEIKIDEYRYGNWYFDEYGRTDGNVDVVKALRRSNDIFFYKVGEFLSAEKLAEWARMFGYESLAGIEEWGAVTGTIPDPDWKEKTKGERWFLGNTYHMSIGQGDVLVSPIQVNRMTAAIAAEGSLCDPKLLKQEVGKSSCQQLNLRDKTLQLVQEGLKQACESGGTGYPLFTFEPRAACKTGTAQHGGRDVLPHAWFTAYAPVDNPEIAITVLVESAGQGSDVAAPVAKEGLEYFFHGDKEVDYVSLGLQEAEVVESEVEAEAEE